VTPFPPPPPPVSTSEEGPVETHVRVRPRIILLRRFRLDERCGLMVTLCARGRSIASDSTIRWPGTIGRMQPFARTTVLCPDRIPNEPGRARRALCSPAGVYLALLSSVRVWLSDGPAARLVGVTDRRFCGHVYMLHQFWSLGASSLSRDLPASDALAHRCLQCRTVLEWSACRSDRIRLGADQSGLFE